ncbi:MAG TPA: decarboxylating 6-phosphogluconate dehydrogenase [Burkholderiales bacterium]|nr:decarboxylating 6-phosphogluconate dehydrogenase [Burkholderiales bacterium]
MQLGMVGMGRMGAGLARRLSKDGHKCVVYDVNPAAVKKAAVSGVRGARSYKDLIDKLTPPRAVWIMVPASVTAQAIEELSLWMEPGDIVIDGGNSYYRDDVARAVELKSRGIHYVDCGTSGGVFGLARGFCLMIGGEQEVVARLTPLFKSIAPGVKAAPRTPSRKGAPQPAEQGFLHCGPAGAGHFVKMVHNGIEYAIMAAYAEGLNILREANVGKRARKPDAETAPLMDARFYRYDFNLPDIAELWRRGSVISSWLLDLTAEALAEDPDLKEFSGRVSDSGEGRWTLEAAINQGVAAPVLGAALLQRFDSQGGAGFSNRVLSAQRKQFGGHQEKRAGKRR